MKVSIITATYNSEKTILDTLKSLENQSYKEIEYIVIDGGSTDSTLGIIDEYLDKITHIVSESDKGIYDAMNKGLLLATGEVIGILNSDDLYSHNHVISYVVNHFSSHAEIDMVLGNVDFVAPNDLTKVIRFYSSFNFKKWKMRLGFMPAHPAAFIKKIAYDKVGNYKLGYKIAADYEMFVRMFFVYGLTYTKLNEALVVMRVGGVSSSGLKSNWVITEEILRSLKENSVYSNLFIVLLRLPIKFFQQLKTRIL